MNRVNAIILLGVSLFFLVTGWINCKDIIDMAHAGKDFSLIYSFLVGFAPFIGGVIGTFFGIYYLFHGNDKNNNYYRRF